MAILPSGWALPTVTHWLPLVLLLRWASAYLGQEPWSPLHGPPGELSVRRWVPPAGIWGQDVREPAQSCALSSVGSPVGLGLCSSSQGHRSERWPPGQAKSLWLQAGWGGRWGGGLLPELITGTSSKMFIETQTKKVQFRRELAAGSIEKLRSHWT